MGDESQRRRRKWGRPAMRRPRGVGKGEGESTCECWRDARAGERERSLERGSGRTDAGLTTHRRQTRGRTRGWRRARAHDAHALLRPSRNDAGRVERGRRWRGRRRERGRGLWSCLLSASPSAGRPASEGALSAAPLLFLAASSPSLPRLDYASQSSSSSASFSSA